MCGFFNVPHQYCEPGPTVYRPYPRRLEILTICKCHYKGSTFSSEKEHLHFIQVTNPFIIYSHFSFRHVEPCSMTGHVPGSYLCSTWPCSPRVSHHVVVSLAVVFDFSPFLFFKFGWLDLHWHPTFNQAGSSFTASCLLFSHTCSSVERPSVIWKVMGSTPVGDSENYFSEYFDLRKLLHYFHFIQVTNPIIMYSGYSQLLF